MVKRQQVVLLIYYGIEIHSSRRVEKAQVRPGICAGPETNPAQAVMVLPPVGKNGAEVSSPSKPS